MPPKSNRPIITLYGTNAILKSYLFQTGCRFKIGHTNWIAAYKAMRKLYLLDITRKHQDKISKRLAHKINKPLCVYRCNFCHKLHVGHTNRTTKAVVAQKAVILFLIKIFTKVDNLKKSYNYSLVTEDVRHNYY